MSAAPCDGPTRGQCPQSARIGMLDAKPCAACPSRTDKAWLSTQGYYAASDAGGDTIRKG